MSRSELEALRHRRPPEDEQRPDARDLPGGAAEGDGGRTHEDQPSFLMVLLRALSAWAT
jgi:hypothetical protein